MQPKEFFVPFWTKRSARFSGKSFYKVYMLWLTFLCDSDILSFSCVHNYIHLVSYLGNRSWMFFLVWIISGETCKSICKCTSIWKLVDSSFLSKIVLIYRNFVIAFCNSFCFCFCDSILRGTNVQKNRNNTDKTNKTN